jgi:hypothetical protein
MRGLPEAREVDQSDVSAGHRVVHRSAGADPLVMAFVEVLEGEHLEGLVCGQRSPDPVRTVGCLAVPRALDEIHLGGTLLQRLVAHSVQDEPRRIGYDDHASRLLGHLPELLVRTSVSDPSGCSNQRSEHLRLVGLDRGQQVGRIEACGKRAPPRLDDRRPQSLLWLQVEGRDRARRRRADAPSFSAALERASADPSPLRQPATATAWLRDDTPLDRARPFGRTLLADCR